MHAHPSLCCVVLCAFPYDLVWYSYKLVVCITFAFLAERWDGAPVGFPTLCTALFVFSAVLARVHADLHIHSSILT